MKNPDKCQLVLRRLSNGTITWIPIPTPQWNLPIWTNMFEIPAICRVLDNVKLTYGRKSADRTEPHFGVIFFVFLSTFFGNLEVCDVKTCNIFWKYMSATWSTCLCLDHSSIGGLFNCPYILRPYMGNAQCPIMKQKKQCWLNSPLWCAFEDEITDFLWSKANTAESLWDFQIFGFQKIRCFSGTFVVFVFNVFV